MFGFGPKVPEITVEAVHDLLEKGEKITIVDVRTKEEVARGKIKGSLNIPLNSIQNIEKIIPNKSTHLYVHCLSGSRSAIAVDNLIKNGYENVFNIKSGLLAWRAKKYPMAI